MSVTIRDIARAAGVSPSSVSRALSSGSKLRPANRQKILTVADKLGYRRNPLISALLTHVRRRSGRPAHASLALVAGYAHDQEWAESSSNLELWRGASRRAEQLGYRIDRIWLGAPAMSANRVRSILKNRGIRGVILCDNLTSSRGFSGDWSEFAVATLGFLPAGIRCHRVASDYYATLRRILGELAARGYRRVGLASSARMNEWSGGLWKSAYLDYQHHLPSRDRVPLLLAERWGLNQFSEWLARARPEVVISHRSQIPAYLKQLGLAPAAQPDLVNVEWRSSVEDWAGVNHRYDVIGATLVYVVAADLEENHLGAPEFARTIVISGNWVDGQTLRRSHT